MLDIRFVRENPDVVRENIRKKFQDHKLPLVDQAIELDSRNRAIKTEVEALRAERNKADKSELKTTIRKFDAAATEGNKENAEAAYKAAVKSVDRAVSKGLLHKNNAARKKSSMASKMNALSE